MSWSRLDQVLFLYFQQCMRNSIYIWDVTDKIYLYFLMTWDIILSHDNIHETEYSALFETNVISAETLGQGFLDCCVIKYGFKKSLKFQKVHVKIFSAYVLSRFSHVWLCVTLSTIALQAPLSMRFSRQEWWSGLPWPSPGDLSDPGIEPMSLMTPALAGKFFTASTTWEASFSSELSSIMFFPWGDNILKVEVWFLV